MSTGKLLAMLLGAALFPGAAQCQELPSATMLADACAACHGTDGASAGPATPSIAGISSIYLVDTMIAFKSGERPGTVMGRIASGYSEQEFELMGSVFAQQPKAKTRQKLDAAKVQAGAELYKKSCRKCHTENGGESEDDSGILASQWLPYLQYSLQDFKAGSREMARKMKKKVDKLSDDELDALLQFFASQQ